MQCHELVVVQVRMGRLDPADLFGLAMAHAFTGIQTPDALEHALAPEHFMTPGDAAAKIVGDRW